MRAALLAVVLAACTREVRVPVAVTPRPCVTRPAPRPPEDAAPYSSRWAGYYAELIRWTIAVEASCGVEPP